MKNTTTQTIDSNVFNDEVAIVELLDKTIAAFNKSDLETALTYHTENVILMEPNAPTIQGQEALRKHFSSIFSKWRAEGIRATLGFKIFEIEVIAHRAFVRGQVILTTSKTGEAKQDVKGKFLCLFEKQSDGSWLRSHILSNTDGPAAEF